MKKPQSRDRRRAIDSMRRLPRQNRMRRTASMESMWKPRGLSTKPCASRNGSSCSHCNGASSAGRCAKLFERASIPLHTIDLDSAEYRNDDWGGKIRGVLLDRTGQPTIPQIFVGGKHVGGCTEAFDAFNDGSLERMLDDAEVAYEPVRRFDAYELLPTWLHPR